MSELDIERELAAADASEMHWYDKFRRVEAENAALRQQLANGNGELIAGGEAWCHPRDVFNYRIGRDISRGRALKALANGGA